MQPRIRHMIEKGVTENCYLGALLENRWKRKEQNR
jgi:hypothetical protein